MVAPSMHPHGAESDALDVTETNTRTDVEHLAQPEVPAQTEGKVRGRIATPGGNVEGRFRIRDDAHLRILWVDPSSQGQSGRDEGSGTSPNCYTGNGPSAYEVAAETHDQRAIERKTLRVIDHPCSSLDAKDHVGRGSIAQIDNSAAESEIEFLVPEAILPLESEIRSFGE